MKKVSALIAALMLMASPALAQDRTLNGFTADTLFTQDPSFIENRFGISQQAMAGIPLPKKLSGFFAGEEASLDIRFHDYFGVSAKVVGAFNVGGDTSDDNLKFAGGYDLRADGALNVKIFRSEEIGAQWIAHLKTSYQRSQGSFVDTNRLSFDLDETYYQGFVGHPPTAADIDQLTQHFKDEIQKLMKDNINKLSSSMESSFFGGGGSISWLQVFHPNIAMMASAGLLAGTSSAKAPGVNIAPLKRVRANMGIAGCVSFQPWVPITLRFEYDHEVNDGKPSNLAVGGLVFGKTNAPVSVALNGGKYFDGSKAMPVGSLAINYYF